MPDNEAISPELREAARSRTFDAVRSVMDFTDDTREKYQICIVAMMRAAGMATGLFMELHPQFKDAAPADVFRGIVERLLDPGDEDGSAT